MQCHRDSCSCNIHLFDNPSQDTGKGNADIEVVLHHEVLLAAEEGSHAGEEHVGPGHASLGVEGCEPFLGEHQHPDGGLLDGPGALGEVDQVPLHGRAGDGEASHQNLLGLNTFHYIIFRS